MRINEIDDEDKVWLELKDIKYDFEEEYELISIAWEKLNMHTSQITKDRLTERIDKVLSDIKRLYKEKFPKDDYDIRRTTEIFKELKIKRKYLI